MPLQSDRAFAATRCCDLSFCIHAGEGLKAYAFHSNIAKLLKPYVQAVRRKRKKAGEAVAPAEARKQKPVYPEARKLLDGARLVLRLQSGSPEACEGEGLHVPQDEQESGWGSLAERVLQNVHIRAPLPKFEDRWLHIGFMNHTTRVFSVLQLEELPRPEGGEVRLSALVEGQLSVWRSFEYLQKHVNFDEVWRMSFYKVLSTDELVSEAELVPSTIEVDRYVPIPEFICWKGWAVEQLRHSADRPSKGGGGGLSGGGPSSGPAHRRASQGFARPAPN